MAQSMSPVFVTGFVITGIFVIVGIITTLNTWPINVDAATLYIQNQTVIMANCPLHNNITLSLDGCHQVSEVWCFNSHVYLNRPETTIFNRINMIETLVSGPLFFITMVLTKSLMDGFAPNRNLY